MIIHVCIALGPNEVFSSGIGRCFSMEGLPFFKDSEFNF